MNKLFMPVVASHAVTRVTVTCGAAACLAGVCLTAFAASDTSAASIPFRRDDVSEAYPVAGAVLLAIVLAVAVTGILYARTRGKTLLLNRLWSGKFSGLLRPQSKAHEARVISSTRLDPRASLTVVEWEGRLLLLARSEQGVTLLTEKPVAGTHQADTEAAGRDLS